MFLCKIAIDAWESVGAPDGGFTESDKLDELADEVFFFERGKIIFSRFSFKTFNES